MFACNVKMLLLYEYSCNQHTYIYIFIYIVVFYVASHKFYDISNLIPKPRTKFRKIADYNLPPGEGDQQDSCACDRYMYVKEQKSTWHL